MAALLLSSTLHAPSPRLQNSLSAANPGLFPSSGRVASASAARVSTSAAPSHSDRAFSGCSSSTPSSASSFFLSLSKGSGVPRRAGSVGCKAVGGESPEAFDRAVYQGVYGPWTLEESDAKEVILYRSGLVTAAASFVIAASSAFLPEGSILKNIITKNVDLLYATGAGGLGLSLFLIHIYVTPIKRFLQVLWVIGVLGSLGTYLSLAHPVNESLAKYVIDNPEAVWFVGPLFASLTGLVFKEGLCYGKLEAGVLTFVIPVLLLGHLTGLMDDGVKVGFLGVWMTLFVVFAGRKFTQPVKDDIGDKSVFMFNALPENEKKALLQRLEQPGKELK